MIVTSRLLIRPFAEDDAAAFLELSADEGFRLHPITDYRQASLDTAREWVRTARALVERTEGLGKYAVIERASQTMVGMGGLTPWEHEGEKMVDITYRLRESAWGKGFGLELARALVTYAFTEQGLKQITATITPDNTASRAIADKIGLRYDRRILLLGVETELYRLDRGAQSSGSAQ